MHVGENLNWDQSLHCNKFQLHLQMCLAFTCGSNTYQLSVFYYLQLFSFSVFLLWPLHMLYFLWITLVIITRHCPLCLIASSVAWPLPPSLHHIYVTCVFLLQYEHFFNILEYFTHVLPSWSCIRAFYMSQDQKSCFLA